VNPLNTPSAPARRADQRAVRKSNLSLVARRIAERRALSRAQLAKLTGLNKTTVSSLVADLRPAQIIELDGSRIAALGLEINVDYLAVRVAAFAPHVYAIGGTSLFGGRGEVCNALFGALVIATIANGLNTLGYTSGVIFIVTGAILLFAVTLDTIARRLQVRAGR
jgi:predicted ABC-type sugar transport system permease subunit